MMFFFNNFLGSILFKGHEQPGYVTAVKSFIGGAIAGGCTSAFVYPMSLMRIRMAMDVGATKADREFSGMWNCLRHCGSVRSLDLYRGFWANVTGSFVYRGCYFGLYDLGKRNLIADPNKPTVATFALYGGLAFLTTTVSGIIAYPFDTIKGRLIM